MLRVVINNTKKTKHEDFSDYLKRKWEARDSSSSIQQDSFELCREPGNEILDNKRSVKSKKQLHKLSSK
jgi:hypothetical protein